MSPLLRLCALPSRGNPNTSSIERSAPKRLPYVLTAPAPLALLELTTHGTCPPAGADCLSFSSIVTMTVAFPPVNHDEASTGARLAFSQASPCWTEPLCMSLSRFGLIQTKSGGVEPSREEITPPLPG